MHASFIQYKQQAWKVGEMQEQRSQEGRHIPDSLGPLYWKTLKDIQKGPMQTRKKWWILAT